MKTVRFGVFETNSSSSHSITLTYSNRKFSKIGKLKPNESYTYAPLGVSNKVKKSCKIKYISEYDKLCVLCDLMYQQFIEYRETTYRMFDYQECIALSQYKEISFEDACCFYYMTLFRKTLYCQLLFKVLNKHEVDFKLTQELLGKINGNRTNVRISILDKVYIIDDIIAFRGSAFSSMEETIEGIIFNSAFILVYDYCEM